MLVREGPQGLSHFVGECAYLVAQHVLAGGVVAQGALDEVFNRYFGGHGVNDLRLELEARALHEFLWLEGGASVVEVVPAATDGEELGQPRRGVLVVERQGGTDEDLAVFSQQAVEDMIGFLPVQPPVDVAQGGAVELEFLESELFHRRMNEADGDAPAGRFALGAFEHGEFGVDADQDADVRGEAEGDAAGAAAEIDQRLGSGEADCGGGLLEEFRVEGFAVLAEREGAGPGGVALGRRCIDRQSGGLRFRHSFFSLLNIEGSIPLSPALPLEGRGDQSEAAGIRLDGDFLILVFFG